MIDLIFNNTFSTKRLQTVVGTNKKEYATYLSNAGCHIQPLDEDMSQDMEMGFGKNSLLFCLTADIIEGDRIIVGSKEYRIDGIVRYEFLNQSHMELTIRIFES